MGIDDMSIDTGARDYIQNRRDALKDDTTALSEFKRQFPFTVEEALEMTHKVVYLMSKEFISRWITTKLIILLQQGVSLFGKMAYKIARLCGYLTEKGKWEITWVPETQNQNVIIF